jgi:hypothetical protein
MQPPHWRAALVAAQQLHPSSAAKAQAKLLLLIIAAFFLLDLKALTDWRARRSPASAQLNMPGKRDYDDYDADQMCELLHDRDAEIKRLKQEVARLKRVDSNPTDARDQGAAPAAPVVGAWTAGGQPRMQTL